MTRGSPQHTKKVFEKEKIRSFNRKKLQKKVCNVINRQSYKKTEFLFVLFLQFPCQYFYNFYINNSSLRVIQQHYFSIKQANLTGRPMTLEQENHFDSDLDLLGPNFNYNFFGGEVSTILDVLHCPMLQSKKTNDKNLRKWQKL